MEVDLAPYIPYTDIHYVSQDLLEKNFTVAMWKKPFVNPQHTESGGHKITVIHGSAVVIVF